MRNKDKAFDYLAEEYDKLTPKAPEVDPDLDKMKELEDKILDRLADKMTEMLAASNNMTVEELQNAEAEIEKQIVSDSNINNKEGDIENGDNKG